MVNNFIALKTIDLLKKWYFKRIQSMLTKIEPIAKEFNNREYIEPYNIILAASDIYYHENYHSDIIAYILENKRDTLKYFIKYINGLSDMPKIDVNNYLDTEVIREENKIDILIRDLTSLHCIIVENKINNAGDMPRQLPKYYKKSEENGYTVDKLLYYSLDGEKRPDKSTWTDKDLQLGLDNKIVYGAAANGSKTDYVNAFLIKCKSNTENEQEKAFYCQYIDLLEYLRRSQMDYQLMEKFYKEMLNLEQYSSALSIRDMLNDFIEFRRDRIYNEFLNNHSPFEKTFKWHEYTAYEFIRDIAPKEHIKLDICSEQSQTIIRFKIQDSNTKSDLIKNILKKIGEDNSFTKEEINSYVKIFKFPEEDELMYKYIKKIFSLLEKNKDTINP
jgi:hypothetical protein